MALVENVKKSCEEKKITVSELEGKAGLAKNSIYKWNRHSPSVTSVAAVARVLGVPIDELIREM